MLADDADDAEEAQDTEHETQLAKLTAAEDHLEGPTGHIKDEEDDEDEQPPFSASMFNGVEDSGLASQYAH